MKSTGEGSVELSARKKSWWRRQRINLLRLAAVFFGGLLLMSKPVIQAESAARAVMDSLGIILLFIGVIGRFWCVVYIGGRKSNLVFDLGPYSMSRHPLYLFSTIATVGAGLTFGSILIAAALGLMVFSILYETARHEERFLLEQFGEDYRSYALRVPRLIPNLRLWRNPPEIKLNTKALYVNFMDALVFMSLIPVSRLLNWLRETHDIGSISIL